MGGLRDGGGAGRSQGHTVLLRHYGRAPGVRRGAPEVDGLSCGPLVYAEDRYRSLKSASVGRGVRACCT